MLNHFHAIVTDLAKFLRAPHSKIGDRIVAIESADHPSDREIAAYAKRYFKVAPPRVAAASGSANG